MPPSPQGEGFYAQPAPTGAKTGRSPPPKSFPLRGRWRRRRRKRCRTGSQFLSTNAKAERRSPLPSSGLRETPDATLPSRGGIFTRSPLRRAQKRNENHLFRHPACGGRRMPPSPQGEGFLCAVRSDGRKNGTKSTPQVLPLEGKVAPQATEEVSYRKAVSFDGCRSATKITSSVIRLAGDAGCHPPLQGRDFTRSPFRQMQNRGSKKTKNTPFPFSARCAIIIRSNRILPSAAAKRCRTPGAF